MKRFVCFDDDGNIYKISKESDDRFKFLECDFEDVKKFIEGDTIEVYEIREVKRKLELN